MLKVFVLPILNDNYVPVIADLNTGKCVIVDPGVATPVSAFLLAQNLTPIALLLTHHHNDHIGGAEEIRREFGVKTYAPLLENELIPFADVYVSEGEKIQALGFDFEVLQLTGHTRGHIGYFAPSRGWLFSGDVLFSMGCGRVFEGTMAQAYSSLRKLRALPAGVQVYCAHEYTETNIKFYQEYLPASAEVAEYAKRVRSLRARGEFSVPFSLDEEKCLNPFLAATSVEEFTKLRLLRNGF